nr:MAG TPA: hypothetical protein [Caudoviricetes sp.]
MCVLDLVLLFVINGIIKIRPKVQTANRIHSNQPKQPRCLVLMSVTACTDTFSLLHLGQIIFNTPPQYITIFSIFFQRGGA